MFFLVTGIAGVLSATARAPAGLVRRVDSGGPVIPGARRERHRKLDVLLEHEALCDERCAGAPDSLQIVGARPVALLDRLARAAGRFALPAGSRARNGPAGERRAPRVAADRGVPGAPSRASTRPTTPT